jgi:hypothetical protein
VGSALFSKLPEEREIRICDEHLRPGFDQGIVNAGTTRQRIAPDFDALNITLETDKRIENFEGIFEMVKFNVTHDALRGDASDPGS